jgi:hypothetical protein
MSPRERLRLRPCDFAFLSLSVCVCEQMPSHFFAVVTHPYTKSDESQEVVFDGSWLVGGGSVASSNLTLTDCRGI